LVSQAARAGGVADLFWNAAELQGVNDRVELAECERNLRIEIARGHALSGVTIRDLETVYIDRDVEIEPDAVIENQVALRGRTVIGTGAHIDMGCVLTDVTVGPGARLRPYTIATSSEIGEQAMIGPFSHLRPGTKLGPETHVGNFVETKKTEMARGSKANHLAYLGDGVIGERVNVGAGTIFCNYDGYLKHTTVLEDDCFIGSDSQIVAPIKVGRGAYVATGTTITDDVPADALAISRVKQENKVGLAPRLRATLQARKKALTQK
jgi:bifunctional UDP-N-acetylglucosamine pyrophosphorylase/glucosamine-1-phosphate N-acetyltransferase